MKHLTLKEHENFLETIAYYLIDIPLKELTVAETRIATHLEYMEVIRINTKNEAYQINKK